MNFDTMVEYDKRRVYSDNRIKQELMKLTFEQKIEFLRSSDIVMERESQIYLNVLTQSRQLLSDMLDKLQNDESLSDSGDEQAESTVAFPFNTETSMGKKLASIAQMFASNLKFSATQNAITEDTVEKAEEKTIKSYARAFKENRRASLKSAEEGNVDSLSKEDTKITSTKKEIKQTTFESKQYLQTKTYLKENLQGDLENAAKNEQEIILAKMKTQGLQLASELSRQKSLVSEKLEAAKEKRKFTSSETVQVEAVNQMIDKHQEIAEMHEKDRAEREQALRERLEQRKSKGSNSYDESSMNGSKRGSKRKKKTDLQSTEGVSEESPKELPTSPQKMEPKAEATIESENVQQKKRKKTRKQEDEVSAVEP